MLNFYKTATLVFSSLLVISGLVAFVCIDRTFLHVRMLPGAKSALPWLMAAGADKDVGGHSLIKVNDTTFGLDFDIHMIEGAQHPYANFAMVFGSEKGGETFVDLSRYQSLSFSVKCSPDNVLALLVFTVDDAVTQLDDDLTYRSPMTFFSCQQQWSEVTIDLTRLETPSWWLEMFGFELSNQAYNLRQVSKITIGNSAQTPYGVDAKIQLEELTLNGREWRYMYVLGGLMTMVWCGFVFWLFRAHGRALVADIKTKLQKDRPLIAYQQLSVEPKRDRDKSSILRYMATEYPNAELNLELVVSELGVSRSKINDILREELGYTFSAYLNKLRLTEAARLLAEKEEANVAEIAYSVGYKNVSYFNKLFKEEYGCTPKTFKSASLSR
ncbi:helix-turn-helix domain-containing protein [Teredinibacter franksiae]|jgi:AraC-type DNA-binding domain-containing proteins|uniref:helix-turn-helix domain-containing protein n=1 Tax=Teredinibacter franksiae TaxID=2761453 RepID=UPI0016286359|nr:helix-turn-helix transcriptional regulator [Teredinibacter franksiae]